MSVREGLADLAKAAAEARAEARAQIEAITEALQHMSLARLSLPAHLRSTLDEPDTKLCDARDRWERRLRLDEEQARRLAGLRVGGAQ